MASAAALKNDTAVAEPDAETIGVYDWKRDEFDEMVRGERKTGDNRGALAKDAARVGFADALAPGARVLDYGCGPGVDAAYFAERGFDVSAFDASLEMVGLTRARSAKVTAWQAGFDAFTRSVSDGEITAPFDAIYASNSLLHAPRRDIPTHLAAIHSALKEGGKFFIGVRRPRHHSVAHSYYH